MKIYDKAINWILETSIMEMAHARKNLITKARNHSFQISKHIVKLCLCPSDINANYWGNELDAWIDDVDSMRYNGNKKLSGAEYYKFLFEEPLGLMSDFTNIKNSLLKHKHLTPQMIEVSDHEAYVKVEKIMHEVCYDMANFKVGFMADYVSRNS